MNGVADNFTIDIGIVSVDPLQQCSVVKSHKLRLGQSYSNFTDSYIL